MYMLYVLDCTHVSTRPDPMQIMMQTIIMHRVYMYVYT